jgi:hypothetical protein
MRPAKILIRISFGGSGGANRYSPALKLLFE